MEKKENMKKRYTISLLICVVIVISLIVGYILWNQLSLKERLFRNGEIRSGESVDDMGSREGVSFQNCLVEMIYYKNVDGGVITNSLHVFSNGELYSVDYFEEKGTISACWELWADKDDRYWDCVEHQQYWGQLSEEELEQLNGYIEKTVENRDRYWDYYDPSMIEEPKPMGAGTNSSAPVESIAENDYRGHTYHIYYEENGDIDYLEVSYGNGDRILMESRNINAHKAIDVIKSTWFYEQWTNQIFGEGWEERIDLEDGRDD